MLYLVRGFSSRWASSKVTKFGDKEGNRKRYRRTECSRTRLVPITPQPLVRASIRHCRIFFFFFNCSLLI